MDDSSALFIGSSQSIQRIGKGVHAEELAYTDQCTIFTGITTVNINNTLVSISRISFSSNIDFSSVSYELGIIVSNNAHINPISDITGNNQF